MSEPAFLALGDLHLDPFIWRRMTGITGDTFLSLEGVVDLSLELYLPLVLLGDLFDTIKPSPEVLQFFRRQMDRCRETGVDVYAIQGNHDKRSTPWYVACHDHVQHIGDGTQREIGKVTCVGFDYTLKDEIEQQLVELGAREEQPQCLFLHQACKQALRFEGQWNCDLEWVPKDIPLVVMGDIHIEWEQQVRPGQWAYYTGPGSARDIGQAGPKSCMLVNTDLSIERLPLPYRPIKKFRFTADDQVPALEEWLTDTLGERQPLPPVAWVVFTPECAAEVGRIAHQTDSAIVISEPVDAPEDIELDDFGGREEVDDIISVEALLTRLVDHDTEPFTYQFVLDLLEPAAGPLDVIRLKREQFIKQQE